MMIFLFSMVMIILTSLKSISTHNVTGAEMICQIRVKVKPLVSLIYI